jgi:hypothetical protein
MTSRRFLHSQPHLDALAAFEPEFQALMAVSISDCERAITLLTEHYEDQFIRRIAVRTVMAGIEGVVHATKRLESELISVFPVELSAGKKESLAGARNGTTLQSLRACISILATIVNGSQDSTLTEDQWRTLDHAIRLRHRITHPKVAAELEIAEAELLTFLTGVHAFQDRMTSLVRDLSSTYRARLKARKTYTRATQKMSRNAPCSCGSGQKVKLCCGKPM